MDASHFYDTQEKQYRCNCARMPKFRKDSFIRWCINMQDFVYYRWLISVTVTSYLKLSVNVLSDYKTQFLIVPKTVLNYAKSIFLDADKLFLPLK